jgi:hypothetical protein
MNFTTHSLIQTFGTMFQFINVAAPFVPPSGQKWVALGLGAVQGVCGLVSHFSNPDGTPSNVAYVPKI